MTSGNGWMAAFILYFSGLLLRGSFQPDLAVIKGNLDVDAKERQNEERAETEHSQKKKKKKHGDCPDGEGGGRE